MRTYFRKEYIYDYPLNGDTLGPLTGEHIGFFGVPEGEKESRLLTEAELVEAGKIQGWTTPENPEFIAVTILLPMAMGSKEHWNIMAYLEKAAEGGWEPNNALEYYLSNTSAILNLLQSTLDQVNLDNSIVVQGFDMTIPEKYKRVRQKCTPQTRLVIIARAAANRRNLITPTVNKNSGSDTTV